MFDLRKIVLATASYFVLTMAMAYTWHLVLFHDFYIQIGAFTREEPILALGAAAVLIQGIVLGWLYPFYARLSKGAPAVRGIRFSLLAGMLVYSAMGPAMAAKIQIEPVAAFLTYHTVFQVTQFVVTGAVLGAIYGDVENHGRISLD